MNLEDFNKLKRYEKRNLVRTTNDIQILEIAIKENDLLLLLAIAKNHNTPKEFLRDLLNEDWSVLLEISNNPNTDDELMYEVYKKLRELKDNDYITNNIYDKLSNERKAIDSLRINSIESK